MKQWWNWRKRDAELEKEIQHHLRMAEADRVEGGSSAEDARAGARREFGNVGLAREIARDVWGWRWLGDLVEDLRYGMRVLRKSPGFASAAILTLALGIGANTAIFSIVDAVLLRPLPYKGGNRLVAVWATEIGHPGTELFAPYRDFEQFRASSKSFEELAAVTWARAGSILTWRGSPHEVLAIPASPEFFSLLGVSAAQGRTFGSEDSQNGCTVVLAHTFWKNELGAPPSIAGDTLTLDGKACVISGVMPPGFAFYPTQTSLWMLITADSRFVQEPFDSAVGIFGRLKPGVSAAAAETELAALHERVVKEASAGSWVGDVAPIVRDLREQFTWLAGRNLRAALLVLWAAVGLVLFIACVNVANLLLGRAAGRQRELAVRAALGSSRSRLMRQLFTESMLVAVAGAVLGLSLAIGGVEYFRSANLVELPPGNAVAINLDVLGFTILAATLAGVLFGLMPALRMSNVDLNEMLKRPGGMNAFGKSGRASRLLVVTEVALSLILLAAAGLFIQSIVRLGDAPLGFRPDHLLTASVALPPATYPKLQQRSTFYDKVIATLGVLPGVEGVALTSSLPPYGGASSRLAIAGKASPESIEAVNEADISGGYFRVLRTPLLRGREFDSRDQEESQPVAIINEEMARTYFPGEDPIGKQIKLGRAEDKDPWLTIVGMVGNEKRATVYVEMGYVDYRMVYRPMTQAAPLKMELALRTTSAPPLLFAAVQREVTRLDGNVPAYDLKTMNQRYAALLAHPRFRAMLMSLLAGLAVLLAAIGVYGVLAQLVSQRTREIGIRMALGANRSDVLRLVIGRGMAMTGLGILSGYLAALMLTKFVRGMLFGVSPRDARTFAEVAILLAIVALAACYVPARRAVRVDPMEALRYE